MSFFINCLNKYAVFSGRATRAEYWIFYLGTVILTNPPAIIGVILFVLGEETGNEIFLGIGSLFILFANIILFSLTIPNIAVSVRRLHDVGKSGSYLFLGLIPFAGPIILLITLCEDSQRGENQYGVSEKYPVL